MVTQLVPGDTTSRGEVAKTGVHMMSAEEWLRRRNTRRVCVQGQKTRNVSSEGEVANLVRMKCTEEWHTRGTPGETPGECVSRDTRPGMSAVKKV